VPLALWLIVQFPVAAADIPVGGGCTLADAITAANTDASAGGCLAGSGPDEILLSGNVTLAAELPAVTSPILVDGFGKTISRGASAPSFRIFTVESGGGMYPTTLTLHHTTISNGGGPDFAYDSGGAIYVGPGASLSLFASTVSNSFAYYGGAIAAVDGAITIASSTLSGNQAVKGGGAVFSEGFQAIAISNSTVSGNTGGTGYVGGIVGTLVTATHSTLSGNTGAIGATTLLSYNNLFADSGSSPNCDVTNVTLPPGDKSRSDDSSCGSIPSDLTLLDPVLRDNGGPTLTHALLEGSNAIDFAGPCGLALDQRGARRLAGECDSGAFEFCVPLVRQDDSITAGEDLDSCTIYLGPNLTVAGSGILTATADIDVVLFDGFAVLSSAEFTAGNYPFP
jgi:hypothetical protein